MTPPGRRACSSYLSWLAVEQHQNRLRRLEEQPLVRPITETARCPEDGPGGTGLGCSPAPRARRSRCSPGPAPRPTWPFGPWA
jgi:hypothetical protein